MLSSVVLEPPKGYLSIIRKDGNRGTAFPLTQDELVFGRSADSDIRIHLPGVSDKHATIVFQGASAYASSVAGSVTRVNGIVIDGLHLLKNGDVLQISDRSLVFHYPSDSVAPNLSATPVAAAKLKVASPKTKSPSSGRKPSTSLSSPSKGMAKKTPGKSKLNQSIVPESPVQPAVETVVVETSIVESTESSMHSVIVEKDAQVKVETIVMQVDEKGSPAAHPEVVIQPVSAEKKSPYGSLADPDSPRACTPIPNEDNAPSKDFLLFSPKKTPSSSARKLMKVVKTPDILSPQRRVSSRIGLDDCSPIGKVASPRNLSVALAAVTEEKPGQEDDSDTVMEIMQNLESASTNSSQVAEVMTESVRNDPVEMMFASPRKTKSSSNTPKRSEVFQATSGGVFTDPKKKNMRATPIAKKLKQLSQETRMQVTESTSEGMSRSVKFGPALSPEIFDRHHPPNSPLKRGTPVRKHLRQTAAAPKTAVKTSKESSTGLLKSAPAKNIRAMEKIKIRPLVFDVEVKKEFKVENEVEIDIQKPAVEYTETPIHIAADVPVVEIKQQPTKPTPSKNLSGLKHMMATPKLQSPVGMDGLRKMLHTPKDVPEMNLVGVREMLKTPVVQSPVGVEAIRRLVKTPKPSSDMTGLEDVHTMMKTPAVTTECPEPPHKVSRKSLKMSSEFDHAIHDLSSQVDRIEVPQSPLASVEASPRADAMMTNLRCNSVMSSTSSLMVECPSAKDDVGNRMDSLIGEPSGVQELIFAGACGDQPPVDEVMGDITVDTHEMISVETKEDISIEVSDDSVEINHEISTEVKEEVSVEINEVAMNEDVMDVNVSMETVAPVAAVPDTPVDVEVKPKRGRKSLAIHKEAEVIPETPIQAAEVEAPEKKSARGRKSAKKVDVPEVQEEPVAEPVEEEIIVNIKPKRGRKAASSTEDQEVAVTECADEEIKERAFDVEAAVDDKPKRGRRSAAPAEEAKPKRGRKAASKEEEAKPVVEAAPAKKGRKVATKADLPAEAEKKPISRRGRKAAATSSSVDEAIKPAGRKGTKAAPFVEEPAVENKPVKAKKVEKADETAHPKPRGRRAAVVQEPEEKPVPIKKTAATAKKATRAKAVVEEVQADEEEKENITIPKTKKASTKAPVKEAPAATRKRKNETVETEKPAPAKRSLRARK